MNAIKWTGLALVLIAVTGIAVWNLSMPGPMAGYMNNAGVAAMGASGSQSAVAAEAPRADHPNANGDFLGQMQQWSQQMWGRMTGWTGGMMGGGMHGHGPGMMGRGMSDRGWTPDARTPQNAPVSSAPATDPAERTTVQMENLAFVPQTIRLQVGETVTWINRDSVGHNVVFDATGQAGRTLSQGQQLGYTFDEPGTYTYYCGPHPFMTGTVVVTE